MRSRTAVAVVVAGVVALIVPQNGSAQVDTISRAIVNFDGAWRAAAKSATSELVSNGISVTVNTTGSQPCEAADDLLSAEAEGLLRRSGAVVRPTVFAGAEVTIRVVSLPDGLRCVSSVYMALTVLPHKKRRQEHSNADRSTLNARGQGGEATTQAWPELRRTREYRPGRNGHMRQ